MQWTPDGSPPLSLIRACPVSEMTQTITGRTTLLHRPKFCSPPFPDWLLSPSSPSGCPVSPEPWGRSPNPSGHSLRSYMELARLHQVVPSSQTGLWALRAWPYPADPQGRGVPAGPSSESLMTIVEGPSFLDLPHVCLHSSTALPLSSCPQHPLPEVVRCKITSCCQHPEHRVATIS